MKALALESFDVPPAVIDVPEPAAGPGEVLVRVHASSVNAFDVGVAAGAMKEYMPYAFPAVIGNDLAGTIESVGEGVEGFELPAGVGPACDLFESGDAIRHELFDGRAASGEVGVFVRCSAFTRGLLKTA